jgi:uncharacterized FlgJ-related protein
MSLSRTRAAHRLRGLCLAALLLPCPAWAQEVLVLSGADSLISLLQAENWWGPERHEAELTSPRLMITGISSRWQKNAAALPVSQKKEIFYRLMLPLALHANAMVLDRRARLQRVADRDAAGGPVGSEDLEWVAGAAQLLGVADEDRAARLAESGDGLQETVEELLYRLDVIPAGLVLGQAAYESGYGTSRFAAAGNALFGQWTFGGEGLVPQQQRAQLGDHRIAAFEWPFDSVRSYYINLSRHPAYEDFRRIRAELKATGKPLDSIALAEGLVRYSERGTEYVETLQGIIRHNNLQIADQATLRDEPVRFLVGADSEADADRIRTEIEAMRADGRLDGIVARMNLD